MSYETEPQINLRDLIVDVAVNLVGCNSRVHPKDDEDHTLGSSIKTGLDCSGFIIYVLQKVGIAVPKEIRHVSDFFDHFGIFVQRQKKGDLVFFSSKGLFPGHMGIMINDEEYVHSPGKNDARIVVAELKRTAIPLLDPRQLYVENPIGFKTPVASSNGRWQNII